MHSSISKSSLIVTARVDITTAMNIPSTICYTMILFALVEFDQISRFSFSICYKTVQTRNITGRFLSTRPVLVVELPFFYFVGNV